ncbi:tyrosine 2,3-aminomutase [Streptomyces sp. Da 82-17]|uniref:tyrosine 2,3-aminomutase n=1 Tax=Streptomyces sp. Da 82-17 TaxID=3377116 RepID=UPI0038D38E23
MSVFQTDTAPVVIDGETLTVEKLNGIAEHGVAALISDTSLDKARRGRRTLEALLRRNAAVEGVNAFDRGAAGAGRVGTADEAELQANLVRSHSTGVGPVFSEDEARAVVTALLGSLAKGYAGVRPVVLERLAYYLNNGLTPVVPEIGSLGAGGDTAPLAHVAATLIGEGQVLRDGRKVAAGRVLAELGVEPLTLRFHEGQALLGSTSAATGLGSLVLGRALDQVRQAEIAAALVTEALGAGCGPFLAAGHDLARPHLGQIDTAANLRALLHGGASADGARPRRRAARPYSLRAVPQVLGAVRHTLYQSVSTLETELNSSGDDLLFFDDGKIFYGANGHGQQVAFAMDFMTIALNQLGALAERQVHQVLDAGPGSGLPEQLGATGSVLHHGFAGMRHTVSALVAENRTVGPASTQAVGSGALHDVVSMGLLAVRAARRVLQNNYRILAVEFLTAVQAVDLSRRYEEIGPAAQAACDAVRLLVPPLGVDRPMAGDIELIASALSRGEILRAVTRLGGVVPR